MPHDIVWVDKVINPRSAVLTHNEALNVLKNAKSWLQQPRAKPASYKPPASSKKISIAQQKEEYIQLRKMFAQQDDIKPIFEMQAELESIAASEKVYSQAIQDGVITPQGLPRLRPSMLMMKEMVKSKKKTKQAGHRLNTLGATAINKAALKKVMISDDEDVDMEDAENSKDSKNEVMDLDESFPKKRKRVIIDSDTEDEEDAKENGVMKKEDFVEPTPLEPSESTLRRANDPKAFQEAFAEDVDLSCITFEADKNQVNVITSSIDTEVSLNTPQPTNVMFTDKAVSSVLRPPIKPMNDDPEEALRDYFFGENSKIAGSKVFEDIIKQKLPSVKRGGKAPYSELLKDKEFCKRLLNSAAVEWDVAPFIGLSSETENDDDHDHLPSRQALNSLFTLHDIEILRYQAAHQKLNESRERHRQRIQHPYVKLRPTFRKDIDTLGSSTVEMVPKSNVITMRLARTRTVSLSKIPDSETKPSQIPHNTVIHEALQYLSKSKTASKYPSEIRDAYKKLSKYPLTFLEKMNLIHNMPKDSGGMLCMLDDLGLRFDKELLEQFEEDCSNLFPQKRQRNKRN